MIPLRSDLRDPAPAPDPAPDPAATPARRATVLRGFWLPHEGGVDRYAQAMADELAARGCEVHAAFSDVGP